MQTCVISIVRHINFFKNIKKVIDVYIEKQRHKYGTLWYTCQELFR